MTARWWGVHLVDTDGTTVIGNSFEHTMRAVDIDGGTLAEVTGNAAVAGRQRVRRAAWGVRL